jgi:choline-sulfatase
MSDEHDPAVMGCYGDKLVDTPNLDRLAGEGIVFDNCYTTSPLCVPARLSFTAGKYISRIGAWSNADKLPSDDYPSIARTLQSAGYETYLCGKMHYDRNRRYGFCDILPEVHSNRYRKTGAGRRRAVENHVSDLNNWKTRSNDFYAANDSSILSHDRAVTQRAGEFLKNWNTDYPPFFLMVGHLAPHFPLIAPPEIYRKYQGRIPEAQLPEGYTEKMLRNYQHLRYGFGLTECNPEAEQKGRELYWALIDWYDRQIGQIMAILKNSEFSKNTIVFYTSDHGENKGEHGLWWKNNMYEHSARIPLIAWCPECWKGGQRRTGACSLVDLVQTIADLANAKTPEDWNGDSMKEWLNNNKAPWKDTAVSEYYGHNITSGFAMLRKKAWKYIYHTPVSAAYRSECELYDLKTDPKEFNNLSGDAAQQDRIRSMHQTLISELGEDPDIVEQRFCKTHPRS